MTKIFVSFSNICYNFWRSNANANDIQLWFWIRILFLNFKQITFLAFEKMILEKCAEFWTVNQPQT